MAAVMMKCGHSANATIKGRPCCALCFGINIGAIVVDDSPPSLEGREACCSYRRPGRYGAQGGETRAVGHGWVKSSPELAFFEYSPDKPHDYYYCGCFGWD